MILVTIHPFPQTCFHFRGTTDIASMSHLSCFLAKTYTPHHPLCLNLTHHYPFELLISLVLALSQYLVAFSLSFKVSVSSKYSNQLSPFCRPVFASSYRLSFLPAFQCKIAISVTLGLDSQSLFQHFSSQLFRS